MRLAVTSPFFHLLPYLQEELLSKYPDSKFKDTFDPLHKADFIEFSKGYDAALIGLDRIDDEVLTALPELKIIALCSAGADHLDPVALKKRGVRMGWVAGINKDAVAEMTISTMINILRISLKGELGMKYSYLLNAALTRNAVKAQCLKKLLIY